MANSEERELMEEVFPLTDQSNLLTPKFDFESLMSTRYLNYGTSATTNYNTNYNATSNYGTSQSYQSNNNQSYQTAPTTQYSYERNTCSNVMCSPLPSKRNQYNRDSFRRHSAHGRITSTGIFGLTFIVYSLHYSELYFKSPGYIIITLFLQTNPITDQENIKLPLYVHETTNNKPNAFIVKRQKYRI